MTESSALGRVTCQPSICPWLDCRARLRNKSALHYADTPSGRMIESPAHCSRPERAIWNIRVAMGVLEDRSL